MDYPSASVLSQPTLVLNESWIAIHTVPVKHALRLLFTGAAKAVQPDTYEIHEFESWADLAVHEEEPCVRTVTLRIKVPEVIVLTRYNGLPDPAAAPVVHLVEQRVVLRVGGVPQPYRDGQQPKLDCAFPRGPQRVLHVWW